MPAATLSLWEDFDVPPQARRGQITLNLYDHLAACVPRRPAAYLRISHDRFGLEAGVDRQLEDANEARRRPNWPEFVKVYKENDTSAFKKRKVVRADGSIDWVVLRPQFRQLPADLASGVIDGVIFYDLDRLVRRPRDLEDLIDIVEYVKRPVLGATGQAPDTSILSAPARAVSASWGPCADVAGGGPRRPLLDGFVLCHAQTLFRCCCTGISTAGTAGLAV